MIVKNLLKYLFTWWNGSTVGTNLYTFLNGKKVGEDYFGNSYYESKDKKNRWCIYSSQSDASRIGPEWNSWLRFISNSTPQGGDTGYEWQKVFNGNLTGIEGTYKPGIVRVNSSKEDLNSYKSDYQAWKPE